MSARIINLDEHRMRDIEETWQLRGQILEHVEVIRKLCARMGELPHVWGIADEYVPESLDQIEGMLTPDDDDDPKDDPKPGDEDYPGWCQLRAFKAAKNI